MGQQLRAHAALSGDLRLVSSSHVQQLLTICNSSFMGTNSLFWLVWPTIHMWRHWHNHTYLDPSKNIVTLDHDSKSSLVSPFYTPFHTILWSSVVSLTLDHWRFLFALGSMSKFVKGKRSYFLSLTIYISYQILNFFYYLQPIPTRNWMAFTRLLLW